MLGESLTHTNHKWKHQIKNYLTKISKLSHEITYLKIILKSKDTEKCMAQLLRVLDEFLENYTEKGK